MTPSDLDLSQPAPTPRTLEEAQQLINALWAQVAALQQRLKELGQPQTVVEQIRYRADNQLESLRYGNGIEERRQYNGLGRLIKQTLTDANGQTVKEQTYQYDNTGNIVKRQTQGLVQFPQLTSSYQYDGLDRLTQESYDLYPERNAVYTFDANGNRLTRKQGQAENEISEIYRYAQNSNRIIDKDVLQPDDPPPEPVKDIEYDAKQRIRKLFVDGKLKAEYRYDARNLRTKKTLYDADGNVTDTIYYHYDRSGLLIGERDNQGQAKRDYVYLGGVPMAQIDIDSQTQESIVYLHTDHLQTPRLATNQNQTIVWKWESDAYGAIPPQGSVTINLRYSGQYADWESGWFYNWNRYYDPEGGKYWTSDPIGLGGGLNTYAYVKNNPLNFSDPFGLWSPAWTGEGGVSCLSCHNSWINPEPLPIPPVTTVDKPGDAANDDEFEQCPPDDFDECDELLAVLKLRLLLILTQAQKGTINWIDIANYKEARKQFCIECPSRCREAPRLPDFLDK